MNWPRRRSDICSLDRLGQQGCHLKFAFFKTYPMRPRLSSALLRSHSNGCDVNVLDMAEHRFIRKEALADASISGRRPILRFSFKQQG